MAMPLASLSEENSRNKKCSAIEILYITSSEKLLRSFPRYLTYNSAIVFQVQL
jgi:hypothetical protein